jgi:phosphatidate phosphatase PAH1
MKTYVIDIDGTICNKLCELQGGDYREARPFVERINKINSLFDEGNTIIYLTARGMGRSKNNLAHAIQNFYTITEKQLKSWGAKYHHLFLGKPAGDFYIDDKGVFADDFFA